jgi:hypothetical protein
MNETETLPPADEGRRSSALLGAGSDVRDAAAYHDIGRAALLVVNEAILADLLQLPAGCHIDSVTAPHDQPGVLQLRVRGAGWLMKAGMVVPKAHGVVIRHYAADGALVRQAVDWGLPTREAPNVGIEPPERSARMTG